MSKWSKVLCERCDSEVIQKDMKQWYFQITKYQDELISGLDTVDWPEPTKAQQLNWIGKKIGIEVTYQIKGTDTSITCFTTRPDTNFGATFVVLAPEHSLAVQVAKENAEVAAYLEAAEKKNRARAPARGQEKIRSLYRTLCS
jgi:leucyl-tRNA synthetase